MYPTLVALNCLGRTCCINAATTARGMQQVGLLFVLSPALCWLYPEGAARARAFARYGGHSNTHPFMIPLFVGILLSLEEEIAKKEQRAQQRRQPGGDVQVFGHS